MHGVTYRAAESIIPHPGNKQRLHAKGLQVPGDIEGRAAKHHTAVGKPVEQDLPEYHRTLA